MPQKSVKRMETYQTKFRKVVISPIAKIAWPLIPKRIFLGEIRPLCVELTGVCNANCVFCAYQFYPKNRKKVHMPDDVFKRLAQEVKSAEVSYIMLSPDLGEPTLAPEFISKIETLRATGVSMIELTTNAIVLHKIGIDTLLERGPDKFNISTVGFNEAMFYRLFRCQGYESMRRNVIELLEKNSRLHRPREINIQLRVDVPLEEIIEAPGMETVMALANDVSWMTEVDSWNGRIKQEMLPGLLRIQTTRKKILGRPCRVLFSIVVRPDGGVHACSCRNIANDPGLFLGNIMNQGLLECYHNLKHVMVKWEQGWIPGVCKNCDMYNDAADAVTGRLRLRLQGQADKLYNYISNI